MRLDLTADAFNLFNRPNVDEVNYIYRFSGFLRRQPQIQRMNHAAACGNAEIRLDMRIVVPHQSGDAISPLETRFLQGFREAARSAVYICISAAVQGNDREGGKQFLARKRCGPCAPERGRASAGNSSWCLASGAFPRRQGRGINVNCGGFILPHTADGTG